jgi:hypothetical protein
VAQGLALVVRRQRVQVQEMLVAVLAQGLVVQRQRALVQEMLVVVLAQGLVVLVNSFLIKCT